MSNIYTDGTYLSNNPGWHTEDSKWKAEKIAGIIEKNNLSFDSLCEVGCGAGGVLNHLNGIFPNSILKGYDISPQAIELAKNKQKPNLTFEIGTPAQDKCFDIALAIDVFEHIEDYFTFLRDLKTSARIKIFHIPLDLSVQSVIRSNRLLESRNQVGHLHHFTKETAIASLTDTGYKILDVEFTAGALELKKRGVLKNTVKAFRKMLWLINKDVTVRLMGGFSLLVVAE